MIFRKFLNDLEPLLGRSLVRVIPCDSVAIFEAALIASAPDRSPAVALPHVRIEPVDITLNLFATTLVYDLAAHYAPGVGQPGARRSQRAPDTVHSFAENNLNPVSSLAQNHDIHGLAGIGYANLDLLVIHGQVLSYGSVGFSVHENM
jgi:hypothetical protein